MASVRTHSPFIVGVDIGGSKILTLVTDGEGRELGRDRRPTLAQEGPDAVIGRIEASIRAAAGRAGLAADGLTGIGLAAAGVCDSQRGIVTTSPNLPGWQDIPLAEAIARRLGVRVYLENDASAAALAEHLYGAGRGSRDMVYLTVSTGVGGGIIIDGRLYRGASGCAGEVGHMIIDASGPPCHCGSRGCLEAFISGWALAERVRRLADEGGSTLLASGAEIDGPAVHRAALQGDIVALRAIRQTGCWLGVGLANLVNIFNPEVIVIGGGLSHLGDLLLNPAGEVMRQRAFALPVSAARIATVQLGEDGGALGAVAVVKEYLNL